jgi:uncharacterized membrane protein YccC
LPRLQRVKAESSANAEAAAKAKLENENFEKLQAEEALRVQAERRGPDQAIMFEEKVRAEMEAEKKAAEAAKAAEDEAVPWRL